MLPSPICNVGRENAYAVTYTYVDNSETPENSNCHEAQNTFLNTPAPLPEKSSPSVRAKTTPPLPGLAGTLTAPDAGPGFDTRYPFLPAAFSDGLYVTAAAPAFAPASVAAATARAVSATGGAQTSAVAWGAILGGAAAAIAATLVLLALGTGLGITTVSPWPNAGVSATTFGALAAIWLVLIQWISSGLGGYLTGRLRTRWSGLHTHEVFFRDKQD